ncbi:MAG: hypothetical protein PUG38_04055 [Sutterellaceae bacterium]|nr:hypothetical protein [Sutterellaceae bacterium]MDY2868060.1 hypothetical protein [Mesosutterella sp.]
MNELKLTSRDRENIATFLRGIVAVLACGVVYLVMIGFLFLQTKHGTDTEAGIEIAEDIMLGAATLFFFAVARKVPEERGGILLIAGFLTALFIREQDFALDSISHSAWLIPEAIVLVPLLWYVAKRGLSEALEGLGNFVRSDAFVLMAAGLAMLLIFSRLYGSGSLWKQFISDPSAMYVAKRISEESMELLSYALMAVSGGAYYAGRVLRRKGGRDSRN